MVPTHRHHRAIIALAVLAGIAIAPQCLAQKSKSAAAKKVTELKERPSELEGYGEHYDLAKFEECKTKKGRNETSCEVYRLRRIEAPEYWPYHKTSPMKWPDPPKEQVYKPGMGPIEYWRALCKAEAGEFIYKTVPNVTSIYQIRPRPLESEYSGTDRFVREDPYGYIESESAALRNMPGMFVGRGWISEKSPAHYALETVPLVDNIPKAVRKYHAPEFFKERPGNARFQRFYGYDGRNKSTYRVDYVNSLQSRYGWTWRGIRRPLDREIGVAGGELAVVDLKTGEVLALRRGFLLGSGTSGGRVGWGGGNACPEYSLAPGIGKTRRRNKDMDFTLWFVNKVLMPPGEPPYEVKPL